MNIVYGLLILLAAVNVNRGNISKGDAAQTASTVHDVVDTVQMVQDMTRTKHKDPEKKKRRPRRFVSIWLFMDTKYTMAHVDRTVFYKSLPFFNEHLLTENVNLLNASFEVFDILACNMEKSMGFQFEHYGVITNKTTGKIIEFGAEDKSTWYNSKVVGTTKVSNVVDFYKRYEKHGCKILNNPYPRMLQSIDENDDEIYDRALAVYMKWIGYGNARLTALVNGQWIYNLYYCNCQVTVLYAVYGFGGYGGNCWSRFGNEKLISTQRNYIDAVYDYCYFRDIVNGSLNPNYGMCYVNGVLYHRHSSLHMGDYENTFKLY